MQWVVAVKQMGNMKNLIYRSFWNSRSLNFLGNTYAGQSDKITIRIQMPIPAPQDKRVDSGVFLGYPNNVLNPRHMPSPWVIITNTEAKMQNFSEKEGTNSTSKSKNDTSF